MRLFGIIGSCRGKSGLVHRLIGQLHVQGQTVSTLKRVSDDVDLDRPGKDSYLQRQAGAHEIVIANSFRCALLAEFRQPQDEPDVDALISRLKPVDLVLIEGFRLSPYPKIEVIGDNQDRRPHYLDDPTVIAISGPGATVSASLTRKTAAYLDIDDIPSLAAFVLAHAVSPGAIYAEAVA